MQGGVESPDVRCPLWQPAQVSAHHVGDGKGKERTVFIIKFDKAVMAREEQLAASS